MVHLSGIPCGVISFSVLGYAEDVLLVPQSSPWESSRSFKVVKAVTTCLKELYSVAKKFRDWSTKFGRGVMVEASFGLEFPGDPMFYLRDAVSNLEARVKDCEELATEAAVQVADCRCFMNKYLGMDTGGDSVRCLKVSVQMFRTVLSMQHDIVTAIKELLEVSDIHNRDGVTRVFVMAKDFVGFVVSMVSPLTKSLGMLLQQFRIMRLRLSAALADSLGARMSESSDSVFSSLGETLNGEMMSFVAQCSEFVSSSTGVFKEKLQLLELDLRHQQAKAHIG